MGVILQTMRQKYIPQFIRNVYFPHTAKNLLKINWDKSCGYLIVLFGV